MKPFLTGFLSVFGVGLVAYVVWCLLRAGVSPDKGARLGDSSYSRDSGEVGFV